MRRRRFLKVAGGSAAALVLAPDVHAARHYDNVVCCPIAGVSFNGFDVFKLREQAPVIVRRETYKGKPCYRILDQDEATIGFVPRTKLHLFANRVVNRAWLSKVNHYAVPWKQLEITVSLI